MPALPQIVFGGASLGHEFPTEESVQEVLTLLKDLKITKIDTAARYPPTNHGMSEKLLGITHAASQGFAISTKIFTTGGDGSGELDRASIQKSFSTSLERLGVDQVDILYIHRPDPTTPLKVQAAAFDELFEGKFKRLGLSNFKPELLQKYLDVCDENDFVKPTVYQGDYNVIIRGKNFHQKTPRPLKDHEKFRRQAIVAATDLIL
ncbi:Oxidoreductase [Lachnellula subtilissima]|uniref:Oxidoreductase n=1 Tax=Lachnellula subtilissima TaxID=602034 RepID=A0A8H8REC7_9HELO|nr:Oxidoreductase [Lachnellula subtilissima]